MMFIIDKSENILFRIKVGKGTRTLDLQSHNLTR